MKPKGMKMPHGFPRYFLGDGVTKFKGPAMFWSVMDGPHWAWAFGDGKGCFELGVKYALPPLRKLVSVEKDATFDEWWNVAGDAQCAAHPYITPMAIRELIQTGWVARGSRMPKAARKARGK